MSSKSKSLFKVADHKPYKDHTDTILKVAFVIFLAAVIWITISFLH